MLVGKGMIFDVRFVYTNKEAKCLTIKNSYYKSSKYNVKSYRYNSFWFLTKCH